MTKQHTPEPWMIEQPCMSDPDCESSFDIFTPTKDNGLCHHVGSLYLNSVEPFTANARRIVACVNACAGIPTEDLERHRIDAVLPKDKSPLTKQHTTSDAIESNRQYASLFSPDHLINRATAFPPDGVLTASDGRKFHITTWTTTTDRETISITAEMNVVLPKNPPTAQYATVIQ